MEWTVEWCDKISHKSPNSWLKSDGNCLILCEKVWYYVGRKEGDLEEEWGVLEQSADIASMAPDDEILAEIYALQSELLQQMAINRGRIAPLLENVMKDLPQQRKEAQSRAEGTQIAKDWILVSHQSFTFHVYKQHLPFLRFESSNLSSKQELCPTKP